LSVAADIPGIDGEVDRLLELYATIDDDADDRRQTVYVVGDAGSGRTALLRALAAALEAEDTPPAVIAGGFDGSRYVPWSEGGPAPERVTAVIQNVVTLAEGLTPYAALLGQVLSKSEASVELVRAIFQRRERLGPTQLLPRLLREMGKEGPIVCVIDDADRAPGGLWGDILMRLAETAASDVPLMLVLAIDRPDQLERHADDEPESLFVARRLRGRALARWHPLEPVATEVLDAWIGPVAPGVARRLHEVTGGRAVWTARLWEHWRASGVVVAPEDADGPSWMFAPDGLVRTLDPVGDVLGARLTQLVGSDEQTLDRVHELLSHAALEGRVFTGDAVAAALNRDRDEVIDLIDDALLLDDEHPGGIVREAGSLSLDGGAGKRHLWLYRFDAELDWLTLHHHGALGGAQRDRAALALAHAIARVYGAEVARAAGPLARLYEQGGADDAARRMRRMADGGTDPLVIGWRANAVIETPDPDGRAERRRASRILLAAAAELSSKGPYHDGLSFAQRAYRLAPLRHDRAEALFLSGVHRFKLGEYVEARTELNHALALQRELGNRKGEADARAALALIDTRRGDNAAARLELAFVLEIYREIGDRDGEAATRHSLAGLYHGEGLLDAAHSELTDVARFLHDAGDRQGEADTLQRISRLEMELGHFDAARERLIATLELYAQLGDRHGEADVRHNLARIELELGDADGARREFMRVLSVYRELGDRVGEAATRHSLASIAIEQGVWDKAKRELSRVFELGHELEDEEVVAAALEGLEIIRQATGAKAGD
jgi:tetratricopeptide (TPR) repeat protein